MINDTDYEQDMEIVERASGYYWVVGHNQAVFRLTGVTTDDGPFDTYAQAEKWIDLNKWREVEYSSMQESLCEIFMEACEKWSNPNEVRLYLKGLGGSLLAGDGAAIILAREQTPGKIHFPVSCTNEDAITQSPFSRKGTYPIAIVLPEEIALKIVALGGIP